MKNKLMGMEEKILLRKRAVIESVNDSEKHLPDRAQPAPAFQQFHGESIRGVVSLPFLTA
jgi:hypothetical protein